MSKIGDYNSGVSKATEILDKHVIEFRDEFLDTAKRRKLKEKILAAMEEYKEEGTECSGNQ